MRGPWLLALLLSVPAISSLFWWLGGSFFRSSLGYLEHLQFSSLLAVVIAGGYQLYFWVQRNNYHRPTYCMKISLDDRIPFWPSWIWFYSFLYYLMFGFTVLAIPDLASGIHLIFGGILVLLAGCGLCYVVPTNVPPAYREFAIDTASTRYLAFVQTMDNNRNAFPSMHCAIATYVGLAVTELPHIGPAIGYGYIVLIAVSCLLVKQHVVLDTLGGILLGAAVFLVNFSILLSLRL